MAALRLFVLICFISTGFGCEDTPVLYNLAKRARHIAFQYLIDDFALDDGWFSATSQNITYVMVTNATLPPVGGCGALYSIYMLGEHPNSTTLPDGQEVDVVACLRSYFDDCDLQYNITIRNCGGELQYYLLITERYAGYCFDPPEFAGLSEAPTNAILGNIVVTVRLVYEEIIVKQGVTENYSPSTVFECGFTHQTGFFYYVEWYYNNILLVILGPTTNVTELLLTDDMITENGVSLGVNFKCGVSVSVDYFGIKTTMNFSDIFFAGIVFNDPTIYVPKTETGTITFKTTLPIGCEYNRIKPNLSYCAIYLHMLERDYTCESEQTTLYTFTGSVQRGCGVQIKTLKMNETWDPEQEYGITIVTKDENYADKDTFKQEFIVQDKNRNALWSNYRPESIRVIITDTAVNRNKYCYSHVDPHVKTPDNVHYDHHEEGYFLLYRNTQYNIEIQERTESCNNNLATCTCAVLVKAGADIVMFETCSDRVPFIGYKACDDNGILQTKRVSDNEYQVHTPIGTNVKVYLYTSGVSEGMINVDIHMSPKDFNHTEGLCGSYDDNPSNDFTTKQGVLLHNNANHSFSSTWKLQDNETYFAVDLPQLTAWSDENPLYCYCEEDNGTPAITVKTTCSAKPTKNCTGTASNDVTERYCTIVSNRNKQSEANNLAERKRRFNLVPMKQFKSSTADTTNITEEEANTTCADVIGSELVATNFTEFIAPGEIEAKIEQCVTDVLDSNDLAAVNVQVDAINSLVSFEMNQDPVYIANNTEQVQAFKQQSCPSNCNAKGTCVDGSCQCDSYFHGTECAIDERDQLTIIDVTGGVVCDLLTSDCTCYSVLTRRLIQPFTFKYRKSHLTLDGNYNLTETVTGSGEYLSIFEGIMCITTPSSTESFVTHYNISISNDGSTFSQPVEMHVYDSSCKQYILDGNGTYTFFLKEGYCNINGACYAEGDTDMDNSCNMCQTSSVNTTWTSVCRNPNDGDATTSLILIVCGFVGGVIVIVVVVVIVIRVRSTTSNLQSTEGINLETHVYDSVDRSRSDFAVSDDPSSDENTLNSHVYTSLDRSQNGVTVTESDVQSTDGINIENYVYENVGRSRSDIAVSDDPSSDENTINSHVYTSLDRSQNGVTVTESHDQSRDENNHDSHVYTSLDRRHSEVSGIATASDNAYYNGITINTESNDQSRDKNNHDSDAYTSLDRSHGDVSGRCTASDKEYYNGNTINTESNDQSRDDNNRDSHVYTSLDRNHGDVNGRCTASDNAYYNGNTINTESNVQP